MQGCTAAVDTFPQRAAAAVKWFKHSLLALMIASAALQSRDAAAGIISFSATPTAANGSAAPMLTWSTTPTAASCVASGAWSGTKSASGTETAAVIKATATYTLTCAWPADTTANLSWIAPTANTDGSTPASIDGYNVYLDDSAAPSLATATKIGGGPGFIIPPSQLSYVVTGLAAGNHNFAVQCWTCTNGCGESDPSAWVSKINAAASSGAASATVNVTPTSTIPNPPTGLQVAAETTAAYSLTLSKDRVNIKALGIVAASTACDPTMKYSNENGDYYRVPTDLVVLSVGKLKPYVAVAKCVSVASP